MGGMMNLLNNLPDELKPLYTKLLNSKTADEIINIAIDLTVKMDRLPKNQREEVRKLLRKTPKF